MKQLEELRNAILLSDIDVENILTLTGWEKIISIIQETFVQEAMGKTIAPSKIVIDMPHYNNDYRIMPSYMKKYSKYCGTKIIGTCADNPKKYGLPLAIGVYILNDNRTQKPIMVCDCCLMTAYRTAAATAVAVRYLSNTDSKVLGIIGCGQQSYYHIPAIKTERGIEKILINSKTSESMYKLKNHFHDLDLESASKEMVFNESDIVVTLTPTRTPHIYLKHIPTHKEMLICSVGGDSVEKIEFHPTVLEHVDHYCDSYEQVSHTGLVMQAIENDIIKETHLKSLGDYMIGDKKMDPTKPVKMFLSTGVALEDLAIAKLIYENMGKG